MSTTEVVQFACIITLMAISYWWFWTWGDREQRDAMPKMKSATYAVAQTGSMFVPSFDPYVAPGGTVFIPVTDGLYATRVTRKKRKNYRAGLRRWLERGADVQIFVTRDGETDCAQPPSAERCLWEWGDLLRDYPDRFHVYLLDRERADNPEVKLQIERLDTFHPVILVDASTDQTRPGIMWIEANHPIGSKYAYDVTFMDPTDTAADGRLATYKRMYEGLLKGPHITSLQPTTH